MMHGWYYGGGYGAIGLVLMVLMMAILVIGGIFAVRYLTRSNNAPRGDDALAILKKRYASGEISREEFEQKRKDLNQ